MNAKELLRLAKQEGWEVVRQSGSHIRIKHKETGLKETIPYHGTKDIPIGTANAILKKLGLK